MTKTERNILQWIQKNCLLLACVLFTVIGLTMRISGIHYESFDFTHFLQPWTDTMMEKGFRHSVGNYTVPYMLYLWILGKLPAIPLLYGIKGLSILFDYILAVLVCLTVRELSQSREKGWIAYIIAVILPSFAVNSGYWGQCDSIYCAFLLGFLLLFFKRRYLWAFILFSLAFSLKLQSIFLLPFILICYVKKRDFSILWLLLVPAAMLITALPKVLAGDTVFANFNAYRQQISDTVKYYNAPNVWAFWANTSMKQGKVFGILFTVTLLGVLLLLTMRSAREWTKERELKLAFLSVWTTVMFLPSMHERYGYFLSVLSILLCVCRPSIKNMLTGIALEMITLTVYRGWLERVAHTLDEATFCMDFRFVSVLCLLLWGLFFAEYCREMTGSAEKNPTDREQEPDRAPQ